MRPVAMVPPAHRRLTPRQRAGAVIVTAAGKRRRKDEDIGSAMGADRIGPSSEDDTAGRDATMAAGARTIAAGAPNDR